MGLGAMWSLLATNMQKNIELLLLQYKWKFCCVLFNGIMLTRCDLQKKFRAEVRIMGHLLLLLMNNGVSSVGNLRWKLGRMAANSGQALCPWESSIKSPLTHSLQKQNNQFFIQPTIPRLYGLIIWSSISSPESKHSIRICIMQLPGVKPEFCPAKQREVSKTEQ